MSDTANTLFTVRVAAPPPSRGSWKVVVRASDESAAAAKVAERGNRVLEVNAGFVRPGSIGGVTRAVPECAVCGYPVADLPAEETMEVTCPECGTVNLGIELPEYDDTRDARHKFRVIRWFVFGVGAVVLLGVIALIAGWL